MTLHLTLPTPTNLYCSTCLKSTEHVDLELDLDTEGTMTCLRCDRKDKVDTNPQKAGQNGQ